MDKLSFFLNDRYKLLLFLKNNEVHIKNDIYIPLSQQEIATGINCSKLIANRLINELKEAGYISSFMNKNGKYQITDAGYEIINRMRKDFSHEIHRE